MLKRLTFLFPVIMLLSAIVAGHLASCSEYDTDSVGGGFIPVNSQVRSFTHLVYVEYSTTDVRIWGPCKDEVTANVDGLHVSLQCDVDSLTIIAYGYPATADRDLNGSLQIHSDRSYALYLNGLALSSNGRPTISCLGRGLCYIVLPEKSKNKLLAIGKAPEGAADGCLYAESQILLGGTGDLEVSNQMAPAIGQYAHAISAAGLQCQYKVSVTAEAPYGDGIHVVHSMLSSLGTWQVTAGRNGISAGDSIVLYAGTYTGTAADGAFLRTDMGAAIRMPQVTVASGIASDIMDSLAMTAMFDSIQSVWQASFFNFVMEADTTYNLVDSAGTKVASIVSPHTIPSPYVLISDGKIMSDADLQIVQEKKNKK